MRPIKFIVGKLGHLVTMSYLKAKIWQPSNDREVIGGPKKYYMIFKPPRTLPSFLSTNEKKALKNFTQ